MSYVLLSDNIRDGSSWLPFPLSMSQMVENDDSTGFGGQCTRGLAGEGLLDTIRSRTRAPAQDCSIIIIIIIMLYHIHTG